MDPVQNRMASDRSLKYDVFISFRGPDTRKIFVSHLYGSLFIRGIFTYKDDRRLELGDSITDELCQAIRPSRFAVVVISKNYATSSWCLDELQLIMELVESKEIEVVPIFYEVKPSDVRHQLLESFSLQGSRMTEKVLGWKKALQDIANRKGMESSKFPDDATMIEEIVQNISSRLLSMLPIRFDDVVGMRAHMEVLNPLLDMNSNDARIIGIAGIGGIGKTTIAKYLYEIHKLGFSPHHYFMENVAKLCREHGLLHLQNQLLSSIFREKNVMLESVEHGIQQLKFRLRNVKVLLVFDDVDDVRQLDALAKEVQWFAPGSRIIITTRNKSLLNSCEVYDVKYLDDDKALQLFQQIAFKGGQPLSSTVYSDFSSRASKLAQGFPLALEALGSYLRGKSEVEWRKALYSFKNAPYDNVPRILNISYESLDELSKNAFLHVACLFNGEFVSRVKSLLHRGEDGIRVLAEKSLIDLSTNGRIAMHHLLEKMGRRNESGNNLSLQPILRHWYDICLLADKGGTTRTEGIVLDVPERPYQIDWKVFMQMENLKYLNIYNRKRYRSLASRTKSNPSENLLPCKLRLLRWDAYPYTTLPSSIITDCLVEVVLCNSKLTTLWSGSPPRLSHLKKLNLTGSMYLKELPDLKEAVYLEELMLEGCISLTRIPESICSLPRLQKLDVSNCDGLKNLIIIVRESEATFFEGRSLHVRSVHMDFLDAEPLVKESRDISLINLSVKGNLKIELKFIGGYAQHLSFISEQDIPHELMMLEQQSARLMSPPYNFKLLHIVQVNFSEQRDPFKCCSFSYFPWLMELNLINLNIEEIPDDIHHMQVLEKLNLSGNFFRGLPTSMIHLMKLKHVTLCNCRRLEALPQIYQLETLTLSDCTNLHTLVSISQAEQDHGKYNLLELRLDNCKHFETLSDQLRFFTKLKYLDISRHDFETVPTSIKDLPSLITLCLNYCKKLKSLSGIPLSIKHLYSHGCKSLETFSLSVDHSVDDLDLSPCFQRKQSSSQFTRFPSGRLTEEVQVCACIQEPKILSTLDQGTRSVRTVYTDRFSSETLKVMAFALCLGVLLLCKTMGNS